MATSPPHTTREQAEAMRVMALDAETCVSARLEVVEDDGYLFGLLTYR